MADPLSIVGSVASFSQLLGLVLKTTEGIVTICHAVKDAPDEVRRINDKLLAIKMALESMQSQIGEFNDDELLPSDLRYVLQNAITSIHDDVVSLKQRCQHYADSDCTAVRGRLKWALIERRVVGNLLDRLRGSESTLTCVLQLINFRLSLLVYSAQKGFKQTSAKSRWENNSPTQSLVSKVHLRTAIVTADSWLRKCGLYGFLSVVSEDDNYKWKSRVCVGFKPPAWMCSKSITFDLQFANATFPGGGIRILPGILQFQNQVPLDSPFMVACAKGDVKLISQHLIDRTGNLGDRAICCGKTPLLLAIQGEHLDAIRYLLEAGADPNIGDDYQILPVFAVSGTTSGQKKVFPQLPPKWASWIQALQLLVQHGASVHEAVGEKTLSMLNINHASGNEQTLEFFRLLISENYTYWETVHEAGWSALLTAIRTRGSSSQALQLLARAGVNIGRILSDGRSPLHLAAELADDVSVLEHLYAAACSEDLNRQDMWGWTPLHYAIVAAYLNPSCPKSLQKIRFFLEKGARFDIKGGRRPLLFSERVATDEFTPGQLCNALNSSLYTKIVEMARVAGRDMTGIQG
ncbi:hypothetical protein N7486_004327 [Penicillium sp. IBT 16267x]|nr:hypothetical protein N7486_004327 [Penicillium sp. IBT 16267x]